MKWQEDDNYGLAFACHFMIWLKRLEALLGIRRPTRAVLVACALAGSLGEATDLAVVPVSPPDADNAVLNDIFGEQDLAANVFAVRERAASLSDERRFAFLSDWVIPSRGRRSFRLTGAFTATHPAPPDAASPGGQLVAPAYDLGDVAAIEPSDEDQQRARFALLFLVEAARGDQDAAAAACERLLALRAKRNDFIAASLWPETLVVMRGLRTPQTRTLVSDLCSHLHGILLQGTRSGLTALDHHLVSALGQKSAEPSFERSESPPWLTNWFAASVETAKTRGAGLPPVHWQQHGNRIDKDAPHDIDLLYYRIPLTGDFDVECTTSGYAMRQGGLLLAGVFQEFNHRALFREGTLRSRQEPLDWRFLSGDWSPDGKRIAFAGERIPAPREWTMADASAAEK